MKHFWIKIAFLLLFILFSQNIFSENTSIQNSIIQILRKDSQPEVYHIFDKDDFIGDLAPGGDISWNVKSGLFHLEIEENIDLPAIEFEIKQNYIYKIELYENRYLVKSSKLHAQNHIKTNDSSIKIIIYILVLFILFILLYLIFRTRILYRKSKSYFDSGDFHKSIEFLTKINFHKNIPYWKLLERSYLRIDDLENANHCRNKYSKLRQRKNMQKSFALSDRDQIKQLLKIEIPELDRINLVKRLKKGHSGSNVFLVELISRKSSITTFAVMKQPDMKNEYKAVNELLRENTGYKIIKKHWGKSAEKHLPNKLFLIPSEKSKPSIIFSTFADEKSTKTVRTLFNGLQKDFFPNLHILTELGSYYENYYNYLQSSHKVFSPALDHLKTNLSRKLSEIFDFPWESFHILTSKKFLNISGKLYPNIIYFCRESRNWNQEGFNLTHFYLHGDLNPENILINSLDNFILIDFEKAEKKTFFYDLAFLSAWLLQYFVFDNEQYSQLENILENISGILLGQTEKTSNSSCVNFNLIFDNLLSFRNNFEQNEVKDLQISLISAFLLRSFYELRDSSKVDKKEAKQHKKNGIYFYALSCILLKNTDFIKMGKISTQEAFDLL